MENHMKYEKPEISQEVQLEGAMGITNTPQRGSIVDSLPL